jgi:uncharacterized membrane protein YphA (DoxX/SURF4 family)
MRDDQPVNAETRAWIGTVFRLVLAGVWGAAGIIKLLEPDGAREAIIAWRIFPAGWVGFLGWALPGLEVVLAALLLVGLFTRWSSVASALLMGAFIVGIVSVWVRGYSIDCGCFGGGGDISGEGKTWRYTSEILRDLLWAGMSVWLVAWPRTKFALDRFPSSTDTYDDDEDDDELVDSDTTA